ncbi:MAG: ComF family protein [Candidatus Magasanikbacteria bacterium]|nr:ComF family protein [Candidatus Magasanikbacteria bacterium]
MQFLEKINNFLKETLFPIFCLGCDTEGKWICDNCRFSFDTNGIFLCAVCKTHTVFGKTCDKCKKKTNLESVCAVFNFKKNLNASNLVSIWKYQYAEELVENIDNFAQEFARSNFSLFLEIDAIVPVPLHPRRFAERGFNQAEIIAQSLSKVLEKPVVNLLKRKRYTKQQAKLKKHKRIKNVVGAFTTQKDFQKYNRVLLVDDVYTTGSTINECANVLHSGGVQTVDSFVLVRG